MLEKTLSGNEGTYVEEQLLIIERNGYPEETYYTFSYDPIPNNDGRPGVIMRAMRAMRSRRWAGCAPRAAATGEPWGSSSVSFHLHC
jgi:hypothetical protein